MNPYFLRGIFVTINIIQTWLILSIKSLNKEGSVIGLIEAAEFSLMIYLFLEGGSDGISDFSNYRNSSMVEYCLLYNKELKYIKIR